MEFYGYIPQKNPIQRGAKKHRLKISDDPIWVPHGITVSRYPAEKMCTPKSIAVVTMDVHLLIHLRYNRIFNHRNINYCSNHNTTTVYTYKQHG